MEKGCCWRTRRASDKCERAEWDICAPLSWYFIRLPIGWLPAGCCWINWWCAAAAFDMTAAALSACLLFLHAYIQPESSVSTSAHTCSVYIPERAQQQIGGSTCKNIDCGAARAKFFSGTKKILGRHSKNFSLSVLVSGRCMWTSSRERECMRFWVYEFQSGAGVFVRRALGRKEEGFPAFLRRAG